MKIVKESFPKDQYFPQVMPKKIIVLHHTVSGDGVKGDIDWWKNTAERVGTPYVIARDGAITQIFDESHWIHHLGIKQYMLNQFGSKVTNERLNQLSIGIELDNWGGLVKRSNGWYSFSGAKVKDCDVQEYPKGYRGYYAFEKYTTAQILALRELLEYLTTKFQIPKGYNANIFDFNGSALKGTHGIWSHTSYRPDKSDCHPQPELIQMLKSL